MLGAIISALATVFRKLKVALPFSSDGHRLVYANSQTALFTLLHFLNIHIFIAQYNIAKIPITYGTNFSKTRICKLYLVALLIIQIFHDSIFCVPCVVSCATWNTDRCTEPE